MPRFSDNDASQLREVEAELGCLREGAASALAWIPSTLVELLRSEKGLSCTYAPRGDGLQIAAGHVHGISREFFPAADRWLLGAPVRWTSYNPLRPEPSQRNVALTLDDLDGRSEGRAAPIFALYEKYGMKSHQQLRTLLCDGPSLLGYVAVVQSNDVDKRQRRMFNHLVPAMKRRLSRERLLGGAASNRLLLEVALNEVPSAAFVLGEGGRVHEANRLGEAWLEAQGLAGRRALRELVVDGADVGFRVTRVVTAEESPRYIAVEIVTAPTRHAVESAGRRWGFTEREQTVLRCVAEGLPNRTLAAHLAVSQRTVESHLTRMFAKAQVGSRSEMLAKALRGGGERTYSLP